MTAVRSASSAVSGRSVSGGQHAATASGSSSGNTFVVMPPASV
ncbi:hypothetical protein [Streptomyces sp. 147326]